MDGAGGVFSVGQAGVEGQGEGEGGEVMLFCVFGGGVVDEEEEEEKKRKGGGCGHLGRLRRAGESQSAGRM